MQNKNSDDPEWVLAGARRAMQIALRKESEKLEQNLDFLAIAEPALRRTLTPYRAPNLAVAPDFCVLFAILIASF